MFLVRNDTRAALIRSPGGLLVGENPEEPTLSNALTVFDLNDGKWVAEEFDSLTFARYAHQQQT